MSGGIVLEVRMSGPVYRRGENVRASVLERWACPGQCNVWAISDINIRGEVGNLRHMISTWARRATSGQSLISTYMVRWDSLRQTYSIGSGRRRDDTDGDRRCEIQIYWSDWTGFYGHQQYLSHFEPPRDIERLYYSVTLACITWFFYVHCDSRYTSPRFIVPSARVAFLHLQPSIWRESESYQWLKSLVVTGRGIEPTTYRSGSECSTTELPGCGLLPRSTGLDTSWNLITQWYIYMLVPRIYSNRLNGHYSRHIWYLYPNTIL
jgi:hypothetical protein